MRYVTCHHQQQQVHRCVECISRVTADSLLSTNFSGTNYASLPQDQQAQVRAAIEKKAGEEAPLSRETARPAGKELFLTKSTSGVGGACRRCPSRVPEGTLRYVQVIQGGQNHTCLMCIKLDWAGHLLSTNFSGTNYTSLSQDEQAQLRAAVERRVGGEGAQAQKADPPATFRAVPPPPAPPQAPPTLASRLDEIYSWAGAARPAAGLPLGERIARLEGELGLPREGGASVAGRVGRLRREVGLEE